VHRVIRVATPLVLLAVALAGCGAEERSAREGPPPTASTGPTAPAPAAGRPEAAAPAGTTGPASAATGPTGAPSGPGAAPPAAGSGGAPNPGGALAGEDGEGGAGDEKPIRQPATFTVGGGVVVPASVSVAPFLAVSLTVVNADEAAHRIKLAGTAVAFEVAPGKAETRVLPGLRAGRYALAVDSRSGAAALVVGDAAGG
jgi:hypothetical protein